MYTRRKLPVDIVDVERKLFCFKSGIYCMCHSHQHNGKLQNDRTNSILPVPHWPCELHPAAELVSFSIRPWLSPPPPAAVSPFADVVFLPELYIYIYIYCSVVKHKITWWGKMEISKKTD